LTVNGTTHSTGLITGNNGLTITSGGANIAGTSTITGTGTATALTINGNGYSAGPSLKVLGGANVSGGMAVANNGNPGTKPVYIDSSGNVSIGNTYTGGVPTPNATTTTLSNNGNVTVGNNLAVNGTSTVSGQSYLNGGASISNNLTVSGPGNGGAPTTIDMGGNRVQDVGTPIYGTDAANKAYVDRGLNKAYEGTAIALAISQPIIGPNQTFAIRAGWGDYENQSAFGLSAAGIIGRDWLWGGSTVALDGGVGWGSNNSVAGKAGVTFAFGGGYPALPLK